MEEISEFWGKISFTVTIKNVEFDYIVVAILNIAVAKRVKNDLEKMGIPASKIALIEQELIPYRELPAAF